MVRGNSVRRTRYPAHGAVDHLRKVMIWLIVFCGWSFFSISVYASTSASIKARDKAFAEMSTDLANPTKSFSFVKAAVRSGDLHGATNALERILRINPGLSNIELELGVLYLRMGASELASTHISSALRSPDVPVWVRNRAKNMLVRANRSAKKHQLSWNVVASGGYDSNANAAPVDRQVLVGGGFGLLEEDDTGRHDTSVDFTVGGQYAYALNSEFGNQVEVRFSSYHKRYDESEELDVNAQNLDAGVRFHFGPVLNPSFSVKPYLVGSRLELSGDKYLEGVGAGINIRKLFSPTLRGDLYVEGQDQNYFDTDLRQVSDRSGDQFTLRGELSYILDPKTRLGFSVYAGNRDADVDWESRDLIGGRVSVTRLFFLASNARPWRGTLSVGAEDIEHDAGDPAISINIPREDDRLIARAQLSVPITPRASLLLTTSYVDVDSSLPNFQYDNWGGSLGISVGF